MLPTFACVSRKFLFRVYPSSVIRQVACSMLWLTATPAPRWVTKNFSASAPSSPRDALATPHPGKSNDRAPPPPASPAPAPAPAPRLALQPRRAPASGVATGSHASSNWEPKAPGSNRGRFNHRCCGSCKDSQGQRLTLNSAQTPKIAELKLN